MFPYYLPERIDPKICMLGIIALLLLYKVLVKIDVTHQNNKNGRK